MSIRNPLELALGVSYRDADGVTILEGFSRQELAALMLRVPDSGDPELDAMIRRARQAEDMRALLAAYIAAGQPYDTKALSIWALNDAAALEAARDKS